MPQGSVLGPVLFLIFINNLPDNINSRTRLFADDCILYQQISSETDQRLLQEDLDRLITWEKTWGMEFHPQKCSVMRISRARVARTFQYHLKGVSLAEEQSSKYLGVDLQSNLSWKNHISQTTKKSNNMLGFLCCNLRQASEETKSQAYFTMVRSNLDYCSTIWSPYQRDQKLQIEMVQRRSARFVTNRYRNTSSVTNMLDYLSWESNERRRSKLHRLVPGPEQLTSTSISSTLHRPIVLSTASFRRQSDFGTDYQQQLRLEGFNQVTHLLEYPYPGIQVGVIADDNYN